MLFLTDTQKYKFMKEKSENTKAVSVTQKYKYMKEKSPKTMAVLCFTYCRHTHNTKL